MGRPFILSLFALCVAASAAAQTPAAQAAEQQTPVFRSGAELVALSVAVVDQAEHFVRGLDAGDFAVYEDGVRQNVSFFAASDVPLDLILLLDTSASMTDKIGTVHEAALGFLRTMRPGDRGAVVAFNDGVQIVQALTSDSAKLQEAVRSTKPRGATALNNAIYVALKEFGRSARQAGEVRRQAIAVLSDGEDTCSLVTFDDVMAEAKKSGVGIYTISLRTKEPGQQRGVFSTALYSMRTLAQETGARSFFPVGVGELSAVYAKIAEDLDHQYALGYAPKNARSDGRFRRVVVQVLQRPELRLRTRSGYFAERASASAASVQLPTSSPRP
ncbi:MAG TPA: VWA domain-containing protein [Vicinamibacterales bacterium]|nr:VWA domain-containing protein [Vicinamibacterales bacterium]